MSSAAAEPAPSQLDGGAILARADALAAFTEEPPRLTRTYLTAVHRAAGEQCLAWMREAGMSARFDAVGNVIGRYEGLTPDLPALLVGSHLDTVRNAGRYDGMLGVLSGIACVDALSREGVRLPFAIEVIGFADEEGVRFGATLLGSRALAGDFDAQLLSLEDADGMSMAEAFRAYGLDPARSADAARVPASVHGFVEVHIEQGPVLLSEGLPVGLVSAIAGASRFEVTVRGQAGHAGTVPMTLRKDAAAAAAEALLAVESRCAASAELVGTVGQLQVPNGAVNVIPGEACFSVDVRSGSDALRERAVADIKADFEAIARRRRVAIDAVPTHQAGAALCAPWLTEQLARAVQRAGIEPRRMPSGAGHDGMALTGLTDIAMLFVRCGNGGISHHPDETMTAEDAQTAAAVLLDFIRRFEPRR